MEISDKIREMRKQNTLTLSQVRDKLVEKFGVEEALSVPYLSELERGVSTPSIKSLEKLASVFNTSLYEFLAGVNWEEQTLKSKLNSLPPESQKAFNDFLELIKKIDNNNLSQDWISTLLRIEYRGKYPKSKQEWYDIYRVLKGSLNND